MNCRITINDLLILVCISLYSNCTVRGVGNGLLRVRPRVILVPSLVEYSGSLKHTISNKICSLHTLLVSMHNYVSNKGIIKQYGMVKRLL